ncbi:pyridine nucleotide-disulfide oxidoreductase [Dictyobacter alpinus]|uniref:Pyridine nucleotide-disulfide oxidoreductase n=1 Tax=Dictyobacter alpinus TaxID=2014873 RepID=A0A402BH53_9CHLR|nr:FAD/NAD(P)-binding oxidoreductase [Dictyobacter alpinus]GCE30572.1 pyridine nucleotide-disulfide oxidoreductase [Dictyobacter alpinus]
MSTQNSERVIDYLLIGGGLAAATAAEEIRKKDNKGSIVIVTQEHYIPYNRPPLSKEYLRAEIDADGIYGEGGVYVQMAPWYKEQRVEVIEKTQATALDTRARTVQLDNGQTLKFSTLLLATGGRPRQINIPGADLPGVHLLRTLDDSNELRKLIGKNKHIVIIGSGFIGLEVAASALTKGAKVTIIEPQERIWSNIVSPEVSQFFRQKFEKEGATMRYGYGATEFVAGKDGKLASVRITSTGDKNKTEDIPCDFAVAGIGIQLNIELAESAGLEIDKRNGIIVDEHLETKVEGIFAAGDVAAYPDPISGVMHFEHWDNAIASGQIAGDNMVGADTPYRHIPYFFSDQFDLSINMVGYPSSRHQSIIRGDIAKGTFTALYLDKGVLRAALMVNDDSQMDLLKELIISEVTVPGNGQQLADSKFDLASLKA